MKPWPLMTAIGLVVGLGAVLGSPGANASGSDPVAGAIAFFSARGPGGDHEIYSMNSDGSNLRNLTQNPADDRDPTWSADGGAIAFSTNRGSGGNYEIYVMSWDGSNQHDITNSPEDDRDPYWDYNTDADIFFVRDIGGAGEIFSMLSDGSHQTNLTNDPADDRDPARGVHEAFGHFGVLFATNRGLGGNYEIFKMASDGSGQTNLTNDPADDREPVLAHPWPFPQDQIAFSTNRGSNGNDEIFLMNADGTDQRNMTNSPEQDRHPFWKQWSSSSGLGFVFSSRAPGGNEEIYSYESGSVTNLSNDPADDLGPSVSHRPPPPSPEPGPPQPPPPIPPRHCVVPRVIGMTLERARARIRARRCSVGRIRPKHSTRVGRVIGQSPKSGAVRSEGLPGQARRRPALGRRAQHRELIGDLELRRAETEERRRPAAGVARLSALAGRLEHTAPDEHALEVRRRDVVSERGRVDVRAAR